MSKSYKDGAGETGDDRYARIQRRAYELWERDGRPHGSHEHHWHQAVSEIDGDPASAGAEQAAGAARHSKDAAKPSRRRAKE